MCLSQPSLCLLCLRSVTPNTSDVNSSCAANPSTPIDTDSEEQTDADGDTSDVQINPSVHSTEVGGGDHDIDTNGERNNSTSSDAEDESGPEINTPRTNTTQEEEGVLPPYSSLLPKALSGKRIELSTLCQVVHSTNPHHRQQLANRNFNYQNDNCALCEDCSMLEEDALLLHTQIIDMQIELKAKVNAIKTTIINSDYLRDQLATNPCIDRIAVHRQTLLTLADEEDVFNPGQVQVKVKIETEEDDGEGYVGDGYDDTGSAASPSSFFVQPELPDDYGGLKDESEDEDDPGEGEECPLFITPLGKRRSSTRKKRVQIPPQELLDNFDEDEEPMQKRRRRGRPKKGKSPATKSGSPGRRGRKSKNLVMSDSSEESSSDDASDPSDIDMALDAWINSASDDTFSHDKRFKCDHCEKAGYVSQAGLEKHMYKVHAIGDVPPKYSKNRHACELCPMTFKTSSTKKAHLKEKHPGDAPNRCAHCTRKFYRKSSLDAHLYMHHERIELKPLNCPTCQKPFTLPENLQRHVQGHLEELEKPFYCETCDTRFKSQGRLERHVKSHTKSFGCDYCEHTYSTRTSLARHVRTHTGEKPYQCEACGERFIDGAARNWHMSKVHTNPDDHHLCPVCGKKFFSLYILKAHLDRHAGKGGVTCEICQDGVRFNDNGALRTHKIQMHGEQPLICDECGQKFMTNKGLKQHKMSHKGEKPHGCTVCSARFLSKWVLDNHMRSHTGERPFVCDKCGKGFKAKKHLDTHVKSIHSEDYVMKTPFKCPHCPKAYPRRGILDGHIRQVHTGERPFTCQVCSKGFALKTTLRLHLKSHGIEVSIRGQRLPRSKREKFSPPPGSSTESSQPSSSQQAKRHIPQPHPMLTQQHHPLLPPLEESMATMSTSGSVSSTPAPTPTPRDLDNCSTTSSMGVPGDIMPQNMKFMYQQQHQHLNNLPNLPQGALQNPAAFFNQTLANYYQL